MSANRNGECCDHHDHTEQSQQGSPIPVGAIEETFRVSGMDCSEEVAAIERALKPTGGVLGVRANLVTSSVTVYHDRSVQSATLIDKRFTTQLVGQRASIELADGPHGGISKLQRADGFDRQISGSEKKRQDAPTHSIVQIVHEASLTCAK